MNPNTAYGYKMKDKLGEGYVCQCDYEEQKLWRSVCGGRYDLW